MLKILTSMYSSILVYILYTLFTTLEYQCLLNGFFITVLFVVAVAICFWFWMALLLSRNKYFWQFNLGFDKFYDIDKDHLRVHTFMSPIQGGGSTWKGGHTWMGIWGWGPGHKWTSILLCFNATSFADSGWMMYKSLSTSCQRNCKRM